MLFNQGKIGILNCTHSTSIQGFKFIERAAFRMVWKEGSNFDSNVEGKGTVEKTV